MNIKNNRGGARPGAGRKPETDKKIVIFAYVPGSVIRAAGGKEACKRIAEQAITRAAKNKIKKV